MRQKALIWITNDQRLQDNELFNWCIQNKMDVFVIAFEKPNLSLFQRKFLYESLLSLKQSLELNHVDLFLSKGSALTELPLWIKSNNIQSVVLSRSFNSDGIQIKQKLTNQLPKTEFIDFEQSTLISIDDLPFNLKSMPDIFTSFRKAVESRFQINKPITYNINELSGFLVTVPDSVELIDLENSIDEKIKLPFELKGGEQAAWNRVNDYFWKTHSLSHYKETRNGMIHLNDSSKFSTWLSHGCISARSLYHEIKRYEKLVEANESTYWLVFELLWRDYFKFLSLKYQDSLFQQIGLQSKNRNWLQDKILFQNWCDGKTDNDFINANMNEFNKTGWMSNRGRQNVASYLTKTLKIDWTWGARYFENHLLDYDIESNWGNWQYLAGVGTDPRDRVFDASKQAEMYDGDKIYRNLWNK